MKKITSVAPERAAPELLTPAETAALFRVSTKALTRWDKAGRFPEGTVIRAPGGHRRYRLDAIQAMLNGGGQS